MFNAVVPEMAKFRKPVSASSGESPKVAAPEICKSWPLPETDPCKITCVAASAVSVPKVMASAKVWAPVVRMLPPLINVLPTASVLRLLSFSP